MNVLVTGACGVLGRVVVGYIAYGQLSLPRVRRVVATSLHHSLSAPGVEFYYCNLVDDSSREFLLQSVKPDAIIHTAAATDVDWCENHPEESRRINTDVPEALARWAAKQGSRFLFISTDLIFDGKKGMYTEADIPLPQSIYGFTKREAEERVLETNPQACVVRLALLYGWGDANHRCFTDWILQNVSQGKSVNLFTDQFRSPVYAGNAAEALWELLHSNITGLLHWGGPERVDRYSFGLAMAEVFGFDPSLLKPSRLADHPSASLRPKDCSLDITRGRALLKTQPLSITDGLARMANDRPKLTINIERPQT
jgi:dTDP-4-dehydrorhamnose reductase